MIPSFQILQRTVTPYQLCVLLGVFAAVAAAFFLARRRHLDYGELAYLFLFSVPAVVLGGSLLFGLTNVRIIAALLRAADRIPSGELWTAILLCFRGSVYYGGLLALLAVLGLYRRRRHLGDDDSDLVAAVIPLFHAFGRIGCFLCGCCYGVECRFGVTYHYAVVELANGVPRLPVQLIEAVFNFALFAFLTIQFYKAKNRGLLLHFYLFAYPVFRFFMEFLRGDAYRGIWCGLSTSQWISLLLLLGNGIVFLRKRKH